MMRRTILALVVTLAVCALTRARGLAEDHPAFVVIVHPKNPVTALEKRFVSDAFLGKRTRWDGTKAIKPVDLPAKNTVRAKFSTTIHGRSTAAVRRYWAQQVFSGSGIAPPQLGSDSAVIEYVASHAGAIGYVSGAADVATVKVVQVK